MRINMKKLIVIDFLVSCNVCIGQSFNGYEILKKIMNSYNYLEKLMFKDTAYQNNNYIIKLTHLSEDLDLISISTIIVVR